jgi:hypothetical protein
MERFGNNGGAQRQNLTKNRMGAFTGESFKRPCRMENFWLEEAVKNFTGADTVNTKKKKGWRFIDHVVANMDNSHCSKYEAAFLEPISVTGNYARAT